MIKHLFNAVNLRLSPIIGNSQGLAYIEFAMILPVFLTLGLFGTEIAYMASIKMQVSQIATSVADNASRIGQTDNSGITPTVSQAELDSVLGGALLQGGGIDLQNNGRVVLSSLERDQATGRQYIHWQRCVGSLDRASSYGGEGFGLDTGTLLGMGKAGNLITAQGSNSVMFAEVFYRHTPIFGDTFLGDIEFREEMAVQTRDDRNLGPGVSGGTGETGC